MYIVSNPKYIKVNSEHFPSTSPICTSFCTVSYVFSPNLYVTTVTRSDLHFHFQMFQPHTCLNIGKHGPQAEQLQTALADQCLSCTEHRISHYLQAVQQVTCIAHSQSVILRAVTPTWRIGKREPYIGQDLCNACKIWASRHPKDCLSKSYKVSRVLNL